MADHRLTAVIGRQISLPGHFDEPVTLEGARPLGPDGANGFECRVRLRNGSLEESVITVEEALALAGAETPSSAKPRRAQERYMTLAAEAESKPEFKLAADEALRYVADLERGREERRTGLARLQLARTGPVQHVATALVLAAGADAADQLAALADEKLDYAKREIVAARFYEFPAEAIEGAANQGQP